MKLNNALFIGLLFSFSFLACKKSNLDLKPYSLTEADIYLSELDFTKGINGVYAKMSDIFSYNGANNYTHVVRLLPGDDITILTGVNAYEDFTYNSTSGGGTNLFKAHYQLINRANTVLQKISEEQGVYTTTGLKNNHRGECLFLRGYSFFELYNLYGTAPVVLSRIESVDSLKHPNSKGTEMLDQAIKDFTEAASLLPASWNTTDRGRVTKNSAYGFLGKALVYRGTINKNVSDYTAAISAFNNLSGLTLRDRFYDNFDYRTENNSESLFEYQSAGSPNVDNAYLNNDTKGPNKSFGAYWGFYENDATLFGSAPYVATVKLANAYEAGDPRRNLTFETSGSVVNKIKKYADPSLNAKSAFNVNSINNPRILRYADIVLLNAEAIVQSGGTYSNAIKLINDVRARARKQTSPASLVPADRDLSETNKSTILSWIIQERFLELAGEEGIRYYDLKRWHVNGGYGIDLTNFDFSTRGNNTTFTWKARNVFLPIPQSEMDTNDLLDRTNNGYN